MHALSSGNFVDYDNARKQFLKAAERARCQAIYDVASNIEGNVFCLLGDSEAASVKSLIEKFPTEFDRYILLTRRFEMGISVAATFFEDEKGSCYRDCYRDRY